MKSFNEWLKERNSIEENIADYTPGFIRRPLQNMGLMGMTTQQKIDKQADQEYEEEEEMKAQKRRDAQYKQNYITSKAKAEAERKAEAEAEKIAYQRKIQATKPALGWKPRPTPGSREELVANYEKYGRQDSGRDDYGY